MWKVFAQSEKSRSARRYRRQVCFLDTYKTVAGRLSRPTRCRVRCSSAVLRSCFPRSNINRATLLLQLATHQRSLPLHTPSCGSIPRHCHGAPVRQRPAFLCVCASGLCGHAAYRRDSSSQVIGQQYPAFQSNFCAPAQRMPSAEERLSIV